MLFDFSADIKMSAADKTKRLTRIIYIFYAIASADTPNLLSIAGTLLLAGFIYLAIYWSRRSLHQTATWPALACIWGLYGVSLLLRCV